ncbi:LamG domain-containing protein [Fibrobacter succinogenes]|uniref:LamG domain-containing protein n=1 Tax=Fibrobacter succinogenes TaxID=833 RepID=UPI0026F354B9|nr:LamG domain-containing protein [Fibrobacter succinogenes]
MKYSHQRPLQADILDSLMANNGDERISYSYSRIKAGDTSLTPYLMNDFLYERPFVNLALNDTATLNKLQGMTDSARDASTLNRNCFYIGSRNGVNCAIGLFKSVNDLNSTQKELPLSGLTTPLRFKSESDWSKMGMKVDRWEKVDGLTPEGKDTSDYVPIRHVERYEVPAITVEDWIEKYSFVVDDLMPHRLRQIRMNFNYQEEIAWECDITKPDTSSNACTVYARSGSGNWTNPIVFADSVMQVDESGDSVKVERRITIDKVPHPVKKNGQFDFVPGDYGYKNLLAIQKDNQNTVTISTVNKIGLSNTQRFYYLFKATANKLDPVWPQHDVVLNRIQGFKAYASALGYQGFKAVSAKDYILPQFTIKTSSPYEELDMALSVDWYIDSALIESGYSESGVVYDSSSAYFTSLQKDTLIWEGDYLWKFFVDIKNIADTASKDSSNTYEVPFSVDLTAPRFALKSEGELINPNKNPFVARFTWAGHEATPDIRAMRLTLKKMDGDASNRCQTRVADFPAMADVASKEFAIQWNSVTRDSIRSKGDGNYCIEAYAVDYAVPDSAVYGKMVRLVDAIAAHPGSIADTLWPDSNDFVNSSVVFDSFLVDTKAPAMSDSVLAGYSPSASVYSNLSRPGRKGSYAYATEDSLLKISYKITEPLNGRKSAPVTVAWNFIHLDDTTKVDHAGDSVWVDSIGVVDTSWMEMSGMRLEDGDYRIRAVIRDAADNDAVYDFADTLRVDKTAPYIESLVSTKLVYPDSFKDYSATISADERHDVASNRTGMRCHYRIGGCGNTTGWKLIPITTSKYDSVKFKIDSLEGRHGKCYLEAACVDAAGNVAVKTDLFYMGERTPVITSPNNNHATTKLIAITGIAPPYRLADSLNTIYRLRYARIDSLGTDSVLVWETSGISVVSALQNGKYRNVSRVSQSNETVLGYLDRNLGNDNYLEGTYIIELGTCAADADTVCVDGPESLWVTDTVRVHLGMIDSAGVEHHFVVTPKDSLAVGKDTLDVSLHLSGQFNSSYLMRVYAKDAAGVGMFDESVSKAWRNPYYGAPNDTSSGKSAVWFYEQEDGYHLQWNGLATGDTLEVTYDSLGFGHTCEGPGGNNAQNCEIRQHDYGMVALPTSSGQYFEDFPELRPLSSVNSKMLLTGNEGHVVMTATAAFHVSQVNAFADTFLPKMKVYFGEKENDGFYWVADGLISSDTLNPLMIGWTVDPRAYGISFRWAGPESGRFPAEGNMTVYAEITENIANNPYVIMDSVKVKVKLPELEIVLPDTTLPDFTLMEKDTALVCADETTPDSLCERRAFKLGSMVAKYGVKYRDAKVMACIVGAADTCIAVLQDTTETMRANVSDSAYQVRWDGKINGTSVANEGVYTLKITAYPANSIDTAVSAKATFRVKYAETMRDLTPANPKNPHNTVPAIYVSEANPDYGNPGMYRYEPTADYLVKANIGGWMLPDSSLVDGIPLKGEISGTQQILKYEPRRFSLAIKRHRKELKLVAVTHFHGKLDEITGSTILFASSCSEEDHHDEIDDFDIYRLTFSEDKLDTTINIWKKREGRGFNGESGPNDGFMEIVVLTEKTFDSLQISKIESQKQYDMLKKVAVWKLGDFVKNLDADDDVFHIPGKASDSIPFGSVELDTSCNPLYDERGFMQSTCEYTTDNYNPNRNLLHITFVPIDSSRFYSDKGLPNPDCDQYERYQVAFFNMILKIPDSAYWNAPFGMDNLVNRTVRFDHTNKTIFGDGESGYWKALEKPDRKGVGSYYDGTEWKYDRTYGLLTPFEVQYLPMYPASAIDGGLNTFLFADEDENHMQDARFDLHFYSPHDAFDYFQVAVVSRTEFQDCSLIANANFKRNNDSTSKCAFFATSNDIAVKNTPFYSGTDSVAFYVSRNKAIGSVKIDSIDYPAKANWRQQKKDSCKATDEEWKFTDNGTVSCYKYYDFASRAHYYYGDYSDSVWTARMVRGDSVIKNMVNSPEIIGLKSLEVRFRDSVDVSKFGNKKLEFPVQLSSRNFDADSSRFFVKFDSVTTVLSNLVGDKVDATISNLRVDSAKISGGISSIRLSATNDTLYVKADSLKEDIIYRKSEDSLAKTPVRPNSVALSMKRLYRNDDEWVKNVVVNSAVLEQLDSSAHSHLNISGQFPGSSDMTIGFKSVDSIEAKRPKELVELRAYLKKNCTYDVAYLNDTAFYAIPGPMLDSIKWKNGVKLDSNDEEGWYRLGWFDVNKLQGNTQFMLLWGNSSAYNFAEFKMIVGRAVKPSDSRTVKSLFEDASVTFPKNSVDTVKNVTVRTVEASDYSFDVFNNLALKGPIVEVLPKMTFADTSALPRIQMKISREEMVAMRATPQTVRLYKVDFTGKRFVPLQNALYGFLNADGSAVMDGAKPLQCDSKSTDLRCAGNDTQWAYLLISAETRTFSVFTAMDSAIAETPNFSVTVLPEIASTANRTVRVDGISRFRLYVDDDSLWANRGDATLPDTLAFTADSNGFARIALPSRGNAIDTSYVFVVALGEPDADGNMEELPAAPAVARALTVNAQFACSVPSDSLWLGLDNGFMAYGANCTHPGYGLVSLYRDGKVIAEIRGEIPDTIIYDGSKTSGASGLGKISTGIYESRYVGVSALGLDMQMAGPRVYTDSLRPAIRNFSVHDSSEVLDRIFTATADVYDSESGVARVIVTPVFGGDTLRVMNVVPDSAGHVSASIRISRKQLAECTGCYLSMEVRVEDYGHNHAEQKYVSDEKLYPYPTELALWYPARESSGKIAHELLGTGHDLDLRNMSKLWGSDVGLYFENKADYAVGINGPVDFGSTPSYSFEARVKPGNPNDNGWHEILSFKGVNALDIRLLQNKQALKLVEGTHVWESGSILPPVNKTWSHVVVTVDSAFVKFYVDGELKKPLSSGISLEREMEGTFSMGKVGNNPSYIGNIADIRMYSRALTAAEVEELSKPVTDAGEVSDVIVVAVKDMDVVSGFSNEFSCSVAGNKYLVSGDSATLTMSVIVENSADYNVVLYARSATVGDKPVYVGESSLLAGMAAVSNTWRAVTVSGVSVHLAAGTHTLTLKVPAGIQIGGAALTTANIPASMIAWGVSTSDKVAGIVSADTVRKIKSYLRYEGYPESSTLRPRIRLRNVSNEPLNGFSVRYYFRGEEAATAGVERYWPNNVEAFPAVHSESANTGYVEWTFAETIPVAGTVFGGDGPHFGLFNSDFTPWDASDDPSFVDPNSGLAVNVEGFYEDAGVVVLDNDNNLIGGSCAEMEDPVSLETKVRVLASDMRGDNQASEIHFVVENIGNVAFKNFDVRYYFFVEEGFAPDYSLDDKSKCSSASMESLGSGRWQVTVHCDSSLAAGKAWQNPVKVALHLLGWAKMWNVNDDPSHDSLKTTMIETRGICVFDSTGHMIYGNTPVWTLPAPDEVDPDSAYHVDLGYHAPGTIPVTLTPEGLILTMDNWTYVELSLVTAKGQPVKSIFNGTVDWTGIDMNRTYLMLKVNGSIKSTKKLSLL